MTSLDYKAEARGFCWLLLFLAERAAELHFGKPKAVPQAIGSARQAFEFFTAFGAEQIKLLGAMGKTAEGYAQEANLPVAVPMPLKELPKDRVNDRIQGRGLRKGFRTRVC